MIPKDKVTAVIKAFNRPAVSMEGVRNIKSLFPDMRVIVVDDSQDDLRLSNVFPEESKQIDLLIDAEYDIGLAAGRNRGVAAAETEYIFMLDDDTHVTPATRLEEMYAKFVSIGADLLGSSGPRCFRMQDRVLNIDTHHYDEQDGVFLCDITSNFCFAKTAFYASVGQNESFKIGGQHWDFFYRFRAAGGFVTACRDHKFNHKKGQYADYKPMRKRGGRYQNMSIKMSKLPINKILWNRGVIPGARYMYDGLRFSDFNRWPPKPRKRRGLKAIKS